MLIIFSWGSTNVNQRGDNLLEYILSTDLIILSPGNKPNFINKLRKEVLDISLCSPDLFSIIFDWNVTNYILTSDDKCINLKISFDTIPPLQFRNPAATNWHLFTNLIKGKLSNAAHTCNPQTEQAIDSLAVLTKLLDRYIRDRPLTP